VLPGDTLLPAARYVTNHAVTIGAAPAAVWPWRVQAGYHRGGWYGNDTIDRLLIDHLFRRFAPPGKEPIFRPSATAILPQFQQLDVGDVVPDGPPGTAYFLVKAIAPARHLVLYSDTHLRQMTPSFLAGSRWAPRGDFTWTFVLDEPFPGQTRLLLRMRANVEPARLRPLLWPLLFAGEALFPWLLLRGVKQRAEKRAP
jgi:hypothetical protein